MEDGLRWPWRPQTPVRSQGHGPPCPPAPLTSVGAGSQKVDYVFVLAQMTHDLQLRHEGFLLIGVSRGWGRNRRPHRWGESRRTWRATQTDKGHPGSRRGYPEPQSNQGPKEGEEKMWIHRGEVGREREREERWPVTELVSGGRKPSCGQAVAQGGLCVP